MKKYCVIRANGAGVFAGDVEVDRNGVPVVKDGSVVAENVRKLYYWSGACAVEQIAVDGVMNPNNCQFTVTVEKMLILNVLQIAVCTEKAEANIKAVSEWKK